MIRILIYFSINIIKSLERVRLKIIFLKKGRRIRSYLKIDLLNTY